MEKIRQTILEVNVNNIIHNIYEIKKCVGNNVNIMPVIKSNGYGTYINKQVSIFEKLCISIVAVAIVDEGILLRENGYKGEIFVLNQPLIEEIEMIKKYDLIIGISSNDFVEALGMSKYNFKIHIEIGTGMGRTGINPNRIEEFIDRINKYSNITIDGIYTHFSCSDLDEEYTKHQLYYFNKCVHVIKLKVPNIRYIHCANSAAIINYKETHFNLVRPGIALYGYLPSNELKDKIDLLPCLRLKSRISFIKKVPKDINISYGKTFTTKRESIIATIPIGYADGIRRNLSNKGYVVIKNKLAPIVGTVCMDSFMVDVTDIEDVKLDDEVYIWDNEKITVENIANIYGTINYEVISTISDRVVRKFI